MPKQRSLLGATILAAPLILGGWPHAAQAADYLADGMKAMAAGDLRTALIQLRNAVKENPKNAEANYQLGVVSLRAGDPSAAEKDAISAQNLGYDPTLATALAINGYLGEQRYRDLLRDFPAGKGSPETQAAVLVGRGQAQFALGQPDEAASAFKEAAQLAPKSPDPLLAQSQMALLSKDPKTAGEKLDAALAIAPNNPDALQRKASLLAQSGDKAGALAMADKAVAAAPGQYAFRLSRAGMLLAYGEDDRAKADVDAVLTSMPNNAQAVYDRAVLLARKQDFKGADLELQKLSEFISRYPAGYMLLAVVKQKVGQMEQAIDAATRYVGRNPNDPRGSVLLAELDLEAKQPNQAIAVLTPLVSAGTKDGAVYELRARALASLGRLQEAAEDYQRDLTIQPKNAEVLARLGAIELPLGNAEFARRVLEQSVALAPNQPATELLLAESQLAAGHLDEAKATVGKLASIKVDPQAIANLNGLLKLASFDLAGARADFTAILAEHPDQVAAKLNLARVARLQGKPDEAISILQGILATNPTQDRAVDVLTEMMQQQKKVPEAIQALQKAHAAAPANVRWTGKLAELYISSGDPAKALALVDAPPAGSADPNASGTANGINTLPYQLIRLQAEVALKQTDQAIDTGRQILSASPELTFVRMQVVRLLVAKDDTAGAANVIRDGLALQPANVSLLQASVALDQKTGGIDAALAGADALSHQTPAAASLKGDVYLEAKRYDDAVRAYDDALKITPSSGLLARKVAALNRAGHGAQAANALHEWLASHPGDIETSMLLADMDITGMKLDEAKTLLTAVLEKQPANVTALNNLAWVDQQQKDPQAHSLAERAYMLAPGPQTADTLGYILANEHSGDGGVALLRQASAQLPNDPAIQFHLAVALNGAGQSADAVKVLQPIVAGPTPFHEKADAQKLLDQLTLKK